MRVNVYAEEMTDRIEIVSKVIDGVTFTGLRMYLELPVTVANQQGMKGVTQVSGPFVHGEGDDDSSAITFWGKKDLREVLVLALEKLNAHYGTMVQHGAMTGRRTMSNWMEEKCG